MLDDSDKDLGVVGVCRRLSQPLCEGCRPFPAAADLQAFLLSHQTPSYFPLSCARCSQTLSAAAAPALAGFKLLLARRKAAKRDAAHPPLLPTTRGAATKTVEALRWLTPAALVSSSADNNAHQLIVSCTAGRCSHGS